MNTTNIPKLDAAGLRKFAFTTSIMIVLLFALVIPFVFGLSLPLWPWIGGAVLAAWGFISPATLNPIYKLWMRFGLVMSRITTPIILGVVYYAVLTPIAFVMRLKGRDPLRVKSDKYANSYKIQSREIDYKQQMKKPY